MPGDPNRRRRRPIRFLFENSLFLVGGAVAALLWVYLDEDGYKHFHHFRFAFDPPGPEAKLDDWNTLHFLVNDVFMAFFFAIAAKEVWESMLPGGALSSGRASTTDGSSCAPG